MSEKENNEIPKIVLFPLEVQEGGQNDIDENQSFHQPSQKTNQATKSSSTKKSSTSSTTFSTQKNSNQNSRQTSQKTNQTTNNSTAVLNKPKKYYLFKILLPIILFFLTQKIIFALIGFVIGYIIDRLRKTNSSFIKGLIVLFALIISGLIYFSFSNKNNENESIEKNHELELIENKIIMGIETKSSKSKLLDLVSELNHPDNDNYIEGKKQGIIQSDFLSPNDDFLGTYNEYWTSLREAYKDIILKGVSVEEYKNSHPNW